MYVSNVSWVMEFLAFTIHIQLAWSKNMNKKLFLNNKDNLWKLKIQQFKVPGVMSIHKIQQFTVNLFGLLGKAEL